MTEKQGKAIRQFEELAAIAEFCAQRADVNVYCTCFAEISFSPDALQKMFFCEYKPRIFHK